MARVLDYLRPEMRRVYDRVPALRPAMRTVNAWFNPPRFSGWGMSSQHALPWDDAHDWAHFCDATEVVKRDFEHALETDTGVTADNVDDLRWRHWIVAVCVRYAVRFSSQQTVELVECGVGDGISAYFACNEAAHLGADYTMHCYDSWSTMRTEDCLSTESYNDGRYASASRERAQRNLRRFADRTVFHEGYVPDSFSALPAGPAAVTYLSIDLNAVKPTLAALEHFMPRLAARPIILFDDYGHAPYEPTRKAIDEFFRSQPGVLFKLPTGQAAYYG